VTTLRIGTSLWLDRHRGATPSFPPLRKRIDVDIAIVGGGITGCACAYVLARQGLRVALLEAADIGRGSTAASTALLMQEPDVDFGDLAQRYGTASARQIWRASRQAVDALVATLRRLNLTSTLHLSPSIYFTRQPDAVSSLQRELARRHRAGLRGQWLSPEALRRWTGIDGAGAILTSGNAQVDPYRACIGLARAARDQGASLFARSRVQRIRSSPTEVRLELARGSVRAAHVIIATGYATAEFKPLAGRFRMFNTYVVATPRLSSDVRDELGLGDVMLWDTERPYHYARWTQDHRLILGGHDQPRKSGRQRPNALRKRAALLSRDVAALWPVLDDIEVDYAWEGLFATTPDGLPYIGTHRRYPRHLFALGYGGNGMTFGFLAAQILAKAIVGRTTEADRRFGFSRLDQRTIRR
jgi:glycine/D-amino acid oxidase-like deaminating enzyme